MSLDDARAKLGRAELHIEALRADIRDVGQGEPYTIPLREELDPESGNLYLRIDRVPAHPQEWGVLIGDAVHNLRSALDNAWWQLACNHLGREPTEKEASSIQFPIMRDGGIWDPEKQAKWVGANAAKIAGELQPDRGRYGPEADNHPLAVLRRLSNVDKHRNINPTVLTAGPGEATFTHATQPFDPALARDPDALGVEVHITAVPNADDKVITIPPASILRDPEVQFEVKQTGFVAIEGGRNVLKLLVEVTEWVAAVLVIAAEIIAGHAMEVRVSRADDG